MHDDKRVPLLVRPIIVLSRCRFGLTSASESQPILIGQKRPLALSRPYFLYRLRMCQPAAMSTARSRRLREPRSRSYTKSRALMPCYEGALHALFERLFDVADAVGDFRWGGRGCLWNVNESIDNWIKG